MSAEMPTGRAGFRHEAALHGSGQEFVALAVPFLPGGTAAGEPTLPGDSGPCSNGSRKPWAIRPD
jgi:hypothetical protein